MILKEKYIQGTCLKEIDNAPAFPDEVFKRYESLKKEKEAILNEAMPE